ncbi:MAG: hypothetical protein ACYTG0_22635 [Planctomycetota bacterium]|jgi:anti-sigma factor RsiW
MTCHETRRLFPLYYDSEGDAHVQLTIGDHLAACPKCKEWFEHQTRWEDAIRQELSTGQATQSLWERIEDRVRETVRPRPRYHYLRNGWIRLLLAAAVLITISLLQFVGDDGSSSRLSELASVAHERYLDGVWQEVVRSESVEQVERSLRTHTGFAVRCPPQGQAGFRLKGGGVCRFGEETAAHIVGEIGDRPVSVFVLPGRSLEAFPIMRQHLSADGRPHRCRESRCQMVASLLHGHVVLVLGKVDAEVLQQVLVGYGSHHAGAAHLPPVVVLVTLGTVSECSAKKTPDVASDHGQMAVDTTRVRCPEVTAEI